MSRMNKWKLEKTKVKVVFRLQFHATHIPLSGWDKLFISFIPADSGKATAKTTKANVRNGTCKWGDPIYETTRLLQDLKTKQYDDKLYKLVVAMGTSRSSVLGEATINLANYADASKPSVTVLPLHGSDSGPALHVTVQLLTSKTGFREFEQQRELRERGFQTDHNTFDESSGRKVSSSEETVRDQMNKVNSRVRFLDKPKDLASLGEEVGPNEEYADSTVGFDGSSNTSGSLYAEKQETSSNHEIDSLKSTASGDLAGLSLSQCPQPEKTDQSDHHQFSTHGTTDWVHGWSSDYSVDNDLASVNEENSRLRGSLEAAESSIHELKSEVSSLQSHADEIGNEAQLFAKQLAAEILSGEMLIKEVSILKSECSKLKDDLEQLKVLKVCPPIISREIVLHQNGFDLDVYQPELGMLGLISHEPDALDATDVMKGKIFELLRELDESKAERDCLAKKMDQMECYYEALVQELEENQRQILLELQNLRNEHSTCLYTVAEMESMNRDLSEQISRIGNENRELERRALTAEAAVKRARLNYSIAVEQLQKDLELLSFQVLSMHEANENLIREAFVDSGENAAKHLQITQKQQLGEDIHLGDLKRSLQLQEGLYRKVEQEFCEMHVMNIYLDVLSTVLRETVVGVSEDAKFTKRKMNELELQLEISAESQELLMQKLRIAVDEVHSLDAKCNDMDLQNRDLKENLQALMQENHLFAEKIAELDSLVMQFRGFENRYEACAAENMELTYLLEKKTLEIGILQNNNFSLLDELKAVKTEFDELASGKENLQNLVIFSQQKLQSMLSSYDKISGLLPPSSGSESRGLQSEDIIGILAKLEDLQHNACDKILQLVEVNKCLIDERDAVKLTNAVAESEIALMKKKLEHEIRNIADKLDASNMAMQKIQLDMESLTNKFESFEFEERIAQQHTKYLSDFDSFEVQLQEIASKNADLARDISALETVTAAELTKENQALMASLEAKNDESNKLASELNSLRESVESLHDEKQTLMACSKDRMVESTQLAEELNSLKEKLQSLQSENQALIASSQDKAAETAKLALELDSLNGNLQAMDDENKALKMESRDKDGEYARLELEIKGLKESLLSLREDREALIKSSQDKVDESAKLALELNLLKESLQSLNVEKDSLMLSLQEKDELALEIDDLKENLQSLKDEKRALVASSQEKINELSDLTLELNHMKGSLQSLDDEKKALISSMETKADEASKLALEVQRLEELLRTLQEENQSLMAFTQEKSNKISEQASELKEKDSQLLHLQKSVSDLEFEKLTICDRLSNYEESLAIAREESSLVPVLENELYEILEVLIATDIRLIFVKFQYEGMTEQMVFQLAEIQKKQSDTETALNCCLASNKSHIEENEKLLTSLNSVKSELEALNAELDVNRNQDLNANQLSEVEIDNLMLANQESEVKVLILKAKLDEKQAQIVAIQGYRDELKKQYNETTRKLTEQTLKTEEFKNLSIHLKELKDKAEADEKPEPESSSMQESLRIAFIKEQYETKLHELKQQLSISKKHSEEMLWKLQDAIDEIENRKKSEACHLKKNEELGIRILDLEAELQQLLSDKREISKAYDLTKAEMECSSISLECCKEEKRKLEAALEECNEEKSKLAAEFTRMKENLENSKPNDDSCIDDNEKRSVNVDSTSCSSSNGDEVDQTNTLVNFRPKQDHVAANGNGSPMKSGLVNDHLRAESIMISMDNLSNELERMKNENSLLQDYDLEVKFPNLQSELLQLQKANEELGSIFPLFNEFPGSGNALERVLALEMELAEALQAKKTSTIHFQSSFLKQHSDEEAVFKSFRDINELIKDMLEIKGRYSCVERELKEMHERYSQLSLQFAEVEGERQKLMMTLKNVRASKKALQLNRSASASIGEHSV